MELYGRYFFLLQGLKIEKMVILCTVMCTNTTGNWRWQDCNHI